MHYKVPLQKTLSAIAIFIIFFQPAIHAQAAFSRDLIKKNLPDTILGRRTLLLPGAFNAKTALLALFPGKWYDKSATRDTNQLISWECKKCKRTVYFDANGVEDPMPFPYKEGVATRLLSVFDYADSAGGHYKLMSFYHSMYDSDGLQTGRFFGGLLGMAKFNRTDSGWRLQAFQPAIGTYGSFSSCPVPKPVLIGKDQYAFMIRHVNGPGGGPFDEHSFLIAGAGGAYTPVLLAFNTGREGGEKNQCTWTSSYTVVPGNKKYFRDIIFTCRGRYWAADTEGLPDALKGKLQGTRQGQFTITRLFVYAGKQGYRQWAPASVSISK